MTKMADSADQELHLTDLALQFRDRSTAVEAAILMEDLRRGRRSVDLYRLLRHHSVEPIDDSTEIRLRESFDLLLSFYGILELASLARYIPEKLPEPLTQQARYDLDHPAVRDYYERHYPILLPRLFRRRVAGELNIFDDHVDDRAHSSLMAFLSLESRARDEHDMKVLLWFLDSGWIGDYSISDTLAVLRSPADTTLRLTKPPRERDALDESISGFSKLVLFCIELDGILERCGSYPLLQSGIWYYYGYWLDHIGEAFGRYVQGAIEVVLGWKEAEAANTDDDEVEDFRQRKRDIQSATGVIDRLTSGSYRRALSAAAQESAGPSEH